MVIILGNIQYRNLRSGEIIDCNHSCNGQLIVDDDIEIVESEQRITFILVVEKDTVFQVKLLFNNIHIYQTFVDVVVVFFFVIILAFIK